MDGYHSKLLHEDDWENLKLKLELDLRSQLFFFLSYLSAVRSIVNPTRPVDLSAVPTIAEFLKLCKDRDQHAPFPVPSSYYAAAYHFIVADKSRATLAVQKHLSYDYLRDESIRAARDIPPSSSFEDYISQTGGFEVYSLLIGDQEINSMWHGQLRLRPDPLAQCLDILLFRYSPHFNHSLSGVRNHKCEAVSNFLFKDLPKFEASRLLRVTIPVDHINAVQIMKYPFASQDELNLCNSLKNVALLVIEITHPVNFSTRRVNCTHPSLNEWKDREDFTKDKLGSTYTRYVFCAPMDHLCKTLGVLMRLRRRLVDKCAQGVENITEISVAQFGHDHAQPHEHNINGSHGNVDYDTISPEMLDLLFKLNILDVVHAEKDYPLDGLDWCFRDYLERTQDWTEVEKKLNSQIPGLSPPCTVKEYVKDHRGRKGHYYSFCSNEVVSEDMFHCRKCKTCATGMNHWHSHATSKEGLKSSNPSDKFLYPIPLSGKLQATHTGDRPHWNETGNASGVDDSDNPLWEHPKFIDENRQCDWMDPRY